MTTPAAAFEELVRSVDYPMFIVTTAAGEQRSGCLVGFATQASINPQRLLVMISKRNHTFKVATAADRLAVHFLHDGNVELATLFGEETGDEVDKFTRCDWTPGTGGVPILSGVRGWATGPVIARFDGGDHLGHIIDVAEAQVLASGATLTFQSVRDMEPGHEA